MADFTKQTDTCKNICLHLELYLFLANSAASSSYVVLWSDTMERIMTCNVLLVSDIVHYICDKYCLRST
jgi:hypothetical protein